MGLFGAIVQTVNAAARKVEDKGAVIDRNGVFSLPGESHTPASPSDWKVYQSRKEVRRPQAFTEEQAMELENQAEIDEKVAESSQRAYEALKRSKKAETEINQAHYKYASVAVEENSKVLGAKASHANVAIGAGVALEGMKVALDSVERVADKQIDLNRAQFREVWK